MLNAQSKLIVNTSARLYYVYNSFSKSPVEVPGDQNPLPRDTTKSTLGSGSEGGVPLPRDTTSSTLGSQSDGGVPLPSGRYKSFTDRMLNAILDSSSDD